VPGGGAQRPTAAGTDIADRRQNIGRNHRPTGGTATLRAANCVPPNPIRPSMAPASLATLDCAQSWK
jgi:hypothetical protein